MNYTPRKQHFFKFLLALVMSSGTFIHATQQPNESTKKILIIVPICTEPSLSWKDQSSSGAHKNAFMHLAIVNQKEAALRALFFDRQECPENYANINKKDNNEDASSYVAAVACDEEVLSMWLSHPEFKVNLTGSDELLYISLGSEDVESVDLLLKHEAINPNMLGAKNLLPLEMVVTKNNLDLVKDLLNYPKTNANIRLVSNEFFLELAMVNNDPDLVKFLLSHEKISPELLTSIKQPCTSLLQSGFCTYDARYVLHRNLSNQSQAGSSYRASIKQSSYELHEEKEEGLTHFLYSSNMDAAANQVFAQQFLCKDINPKKNPMYEL